MCRRGKIRFPWTRIRLNVHDFLGSSRRGYFKKVGECAEFETRVPLRIPQIGNISSLNALPNNLLLRPPTNIRVKVTKKDHVPIVAHQ